MHPAPSVIIFTVISGLGFGLLFWLSLGIPNVTGVAAFWYCAVAYVLTVGGLVASIFHLGNPKNAYKSYTQWRTSWLSREAWLAVLALMVFAGFAIGIIFFETKVSLLGIVAALLSAAAVYCTSMIYAQLKTIPRWNHWSVPIYFFTFSLAGGAILAGQNKTACGLVILATAAQMLMWKIGDQLFAQSESTVETATGLGTIGNVRLFEPPHTGTNYLLDEMVYVVARKHTQKLRVLTIILVCVLPLLVLFILPQHLLSTALTALFFLTGSFISRWLFFAQAEHVVGIYYAKR